MLKGQDSEMLMSVGKEMGNYSGKWIAIVDSQIVDKGPNAKNLFNRIKKNYPDKTPLVMKVPTEGVMLL